MISNTKSSLMSGQTFLNTVSEIVDNKYNNAFKLSSNKSPTKVRDNPEKISIVGRVGFKEQIKPDIIVPNGQANRHILSETL